MNALRRYVAALPDDECRAIHAQGVDWERAGTVADGPLRHHAVKWTVAAGLNDGSPLALWMRELLTEVWRRYAVAALERTALEPAASGENNPTRVRDYGFMPPRQE